MQVEISRESALDSNTKTYLTKSVESNQFEKLIFAHLVGKLPVFCRIYTLYSVFKVCL